MSRSYKKSPYAPATPNHGAKRFANKRVRRQTDGSEERALNLKGTNYKKVYPTWDIRDFSFYGGTFEEFYAQALEVWKNTGYYPGRGKRHDEPPSREYCKILYDKWYRRK